MALLWLLVAPRLPIRRRMALALVGAGGLLAVACAFAPQTMVRITGGGSPLEVRSILERRWLMEQALRQITAHPLLGIGAGTFPLALREGLPPGYRPEPVHHVGVLITAELGLPGALLGLGVAGAFLRSVRRGASPEACALAASLLGLLVVSMLDHPLWTLAPARALGACLLGAWAGQLQADAEPALTSSPRDGSARGEPAEGSRNAGRKSTPIPHDEPSIARAAPIPPE